MSTSRFPGHRGVWVRRPRHGDGASRGSRGVAFPCYITVRFSLTSTPGDVTLRAPTSATRGTVLRSPAVRVEESPHLG